MNLVKIELPRRDNGIEIGKNSIATEKIAVVNLLFRQFTDKLSDTGLLEKSDVADIRYIIESFMDDLSKRLEDEIPIYEPLFEDEDKDEEEIVFYN